MLLQHHTPASMVVGQLLRFVRLPELRLIGKFVTDGFCCDKNFLLLCLDAADFLPLDCPELIETG